MPSLSTPASILSRPARPIAHLAPRHCDSGGLSGRDMRRRRLMSYGADLADTAPDRRLYRPHPQGREACRPAGPAVDQVRVVINLQTAKDARPHRAGHAARHRRRGDRMMKRREFITLLGGAACRVAARGARAAAGAAGGRVYQRRVGRCRRALCGRVPQRPQRNRLRRRPERDGRVPLAGGPIRSPAGTDGRSGPPPEWP